MQPSMHRLYGRAGRAWIIVLAAPFLSLLLLFSWLQNARDTLLLADYVADRDPDSNNILHQSKMNQPHYNDTVSNGCSRRILPGMEDILVILKTGVTEALEKVPVHVETTLRCVPNYVIFSDYEEVIAGVRTHDVLQNVSDRVKREFPEFDMYNRVQRDGRAALTPDDYGDDSNGPFGRLNNAGWTLDKWKFIPMIDAALEVAPTAQWFVFMEADTYLMWPNLLSWLGRLDHHRPLYLGAQMAIGDTIFAHGGSGFVISNPAMRQVSDHRATNRDRLDQITAEEWAGDCALGRVLNDVEVPLTWSWPMLQGARAWDLDPFDENYEIDMWCYPVVSYHHMDPTDIREFWESDGALFGPDNVNSRIILHSDVFRTLVLPEILIDRDDWDNLSEDPVRVNGEDPESEVDRTLSPDDCAKRCASRRDCLQYAYHSDGQCLLSRGPKRGVPTAGVRSNWMLDRILKKVDGLGQTCSHAHFIMP